MQKCTPRPRLRRIRIYVHGYTYMDIDRPLSVGWQRLTHVYEYSLPPAGVRNENDYCNALA